ncbi:uncharacterized protein LOC122625516 [Drosophila teissieri]|uniref:uncharacterized protein LOC122625516 n=1 Tax=Drosophila teissieri TaxID=7243 RepID=UPI001CB9FE47|nr:uncharacterized protein LOC122625516 [Drosophila teissieri]
MWSPWWDEPPYESLMAICISHGLFEVIRRTSANNQKHTHVFLQLFFVFRYFISLNRTQAQLSTPPAVFKFGVISVPDQRFWHLVLHTSNRRLQAVPPEQHGQQSSRCTSIIRTSLLAEAIG